MPDNSEYGILVVDDDEPIVKNMRRVLRRKGFTRVISALNAEQGIKLLETATPPFFLIMSDQRMPGMNGSQFLEKSIMLSPESRRMLVTGYSDFDAIMNAVNKGQIHQYITKPWNNDDLVLRIMGELDKYKSFQERKRLYRITNRQNAKLFDLAAARKKEIDRFAATLKQKKQEIDQLQAAIIEAENKASLGNNFAGLDELLSRTITMNAANLSSAFRITGRELISMMQAIAVRSMLKFSPGNIKVNPSIINTLDDETFDLIDRIIENVIIASEDRLFSICSVPDTNTTSDNYTKVPEFDELAVNDGFITENERIQARAALEELQPSSGSLTIDRVLLEKGFLKRRDVSRIFAKLAMIRTRISDRQFAQMLLNRELVSKKDIDRAFLKQMNTFENSGITLLLGDILVGFKAISPEIRDEIMAAQDREKTMKPHTDQKTEDQVRQTDKPDTRGGFIELEVAKDRLSAWIRIPLSMLGKNDIEPVKNVIRTSAIKYGIIDDAVIRAFIKNCKNPNEKLIIARGIAPKHGKPSKIIYHFTTGPGTAGIINEDGSIDFRSRGDAPFVRKGQLLAEKTQMEDPRPGMDIFGETIPVEEIDEVKLQGKQGVVLSEDGTRLIADRDGQPSIDADGAVSVFESLTIRGDVNFKTGNIKFRGNVLVTGTVREGFTVECEELTANEINGAVIRTGGDLKVSNGIVNTDIQAQGSVQAKFLNRVKLYGFKDVMITREIMESTIIISGALNNETGRVTASTICAGKGMILKQVGTGKSEYSTLKAGSDDHIRWIETEYDAKIEECIKHIDIINEEKNKYDNIFNSLHIDIAGQTLAQEKIVKRIDYLKSRKNIKTSKEEIKELEASVRKADERIRSLFAQQDSILEKSGECEDKINALNNEIRQIQGRKKHIMESLGNNGGVAEIRILKKLYPGTKIKGAQASMIIKQEFGPSRFKEIDTEDPEIPKLIIHQPLKT